ncbi:MAG: 2-oxoglutarate dehydrogenase [Bryobacterales bacterium]|nr:2-oxoglutarate dehydrogenase [Bryobacterales bacterium]
MRAISISEPAATLIAVGEQRFKVRSWRPEFRGPLAIHVSSRYPRRLQWRSSQIEACRRLQRHGIWVPSVELMRTLGMVIAIVDFVGAYRCEDVDQHCGIRPGSPDYELDTYEAGRFAWKFENPRRLQRPERFPGTKGFFFVPDALLAAPMVGAN